MDSMNLPLRGARESAITTRYVGALVFPTRRKRMWTANSSVILPTCGRNADERESVPNSADAWHPRDLRQAPAPAPLGQPAHLLHQLLHLGELLQQLVHLGDGRARSGCDATPARPLDERGVRALGP